MSQDEIDAVLAGSDKASAGAGEDESSLQSDADILDLTEAMAAREAAPATFQTIEGEPDVIFSEVQAASVQMRAAAPAPTPIHPAPADDALLSNATNAAVNAAFNELARTVLVQNSRTLEDLVREMLRPILKSWLDDNLPNLVERLVRAEIERVSRGRS
jgi:cell pole-organizing protein PopZ